MSNDVTGRGIGDGKSGPGFGTNPCAVDAPLLAEEVGVVQAWFLWLIWNSSFHIPSLYGPPGKVKDRSRTDMFVAP